MSETKWTKEQSEAIEKRDKNILVSASAGSGKTAVLVERIIQKVVNEYLDVDKILVVTFTNAAAQELKEKILNAIYKALNTQKDIKQINHLKNQLIYINRASITTIDAFCLRLVKENFNILNIDPNIKICEESQSILIKSKILEELLENEYEGYVDKKDVFGLYNILELFNGKDEELLENILRIYNYIQSFPYPFDWLREQIEKYNINEDVDLYNTDFGKDIYQDIVDEIELCIIKYDEYLDKIQLNEEFNKCFELLNEDLYMLKSCINIDVSNWDTLYDNINEIEFKRFNIGKVSDIELKEEISTFRKSEVKDVIEKCKKRIYAKSKEIIEDNKIAYSYLSYLYNFLLEFDTRFKEEKRVQGVAEFNDIMHYALELLLDKEYNLTDIAISLKDRYKEIYTDEYQDTSFVQEKILEAISKENNRFMVGDIKQSIYGFRQARPDIFNEKYITYKKGNECSDEDINSKIILSKNFRSRYQVIDGINYIFEKIMSMKNGQCNYDNDETLKCGNTNYIDQEREMYNTQINIIDLKEEEKNIFEENEEQENIDEDLTSTQIEAKCIAYRIKDIIQNVKVSSKDNTLRDATYKDIVILLRGIKNKADIIEQVLKENDIPVFCDTSSSIFEGDEVKLILSFLKILDNPYQDVYMVSILYSIIGGFTLDEITKIRLYDSKSYVYDTLNNILKDDEFLKDEKELVRKIDTFLKLIEKYIKYSKIYNISDLLVRIYKDTNMYYQFDLEEDAQSKKANLDYLIELASNFYSYAGNTLNSYIKYVDNLKDKQDNSSSAAKIIGENENVVRIMTIHKSKGLEFPIVILADCAKGYNFKDARQQKVLLHHSYGIGIDVVNQNLGVTYPSVIKQSVKSVIEKETKSEEMRLLYVALTRAKEKLYLFVTVSDFEKDYNMQSINIKNNKFNETLISLNTSYYKNLLPVIKYYDKYDKDKNILDIVHLKINSNITDDKLKELFKVKEDNIVNMSISDKLQKIFNNKELSVDNSTIEKLKDTFDSEYNYIEDTKSPARISVSNLKKESSQEAISKFKDESDEEIMDEKFKMPYELSEDKNIYTAVRKGILIHFILQNLDFSLTTKEEIKDYIDKLYEKGIINEYDKKYISINKIYNFLNSSIGKGIKNANAIFREYEFILDDKTISNSLIQGVIDLFFVVDGKAILVDFKTDRLEDENEFIKRYKIQLDIYKEAINKLTKYIVDKVYIYSFNLNKAIEIREDKNE